MRVRVLPRDLLLAGGEGGVDRSDLRGMDGELAGEAFGRSGASLGNQARLIAEVGEHPVDRLNFGRDRARQT